MINVVLSGAVFWRRKTEEVVRKLDGEVGGSRRAGRSARWNPPDNGTVKLNCDVSVSQGGASVGVGFVCRNINGQLVLAIGERLQKFKVGLCLVLPNWLQS